MLRYAPISAGLSSEKKYQREYKKSNWDAIKASQRKWYNENVKEEAATATATISYVKQKPKAMPDVYRSSRWGSIYYKAERLDRIVMLSTALSIYNIEKISYGYLSAIYESSRYMTLLYKILKIKADERSALYETKSPKRRA